MVLYGITLIPLANELIVADSGLLLPLYADYATFDSLVVSLRTPCRRGRGGGGYPQLIEGEGFTPHAGAHALRAWPGTGDGGRPPKPAEGPHRKTKWE